MPATVNHNYGTPKENVPPLLAVPISGFVTIGIKNSNGNIVARTTTDKKGQWNEAFELSDGSYTVEFRGLFRPIGVGIRSIYSSPVTSIDISIVVPLPLATEITLVNVTPIGNIETIVPITEPPAIAPSPTREQVDIVSSLPPGTNTIGKLASNSGVDIGDVDVTSVVPGIGSTNLGKAEDEPHASGDVGVMALTVRRDLPVALAGANGDYQPLITDSIGRLHIIPRDRRTDNVGVALQTDVILNDTTTLTPKFARINGNTSGDNTLVGAVSGKQIRVLSMLIVSSGNVTVNIEDGASSDTYLSGPYEFDGLGQPKDINLPFSPIGHFETGSNTLLNMELDAAVTVGGHLVYVEI